MIISINEISNQIQNSLMILKSLKKAFINLISYLSKIYSKLVNIQCTPFKFRIKQGYHYLCLLTEGTEIVSSCYQTEPTP